MWSNELADLFPIRSQTPGRDRVWLARLFEFVRERNPFYRYLEAGSYLGGTLTPALLDDRCEHVLSIDSRPTLQPDARSAMFDYSGVTTEKMLQTLKDAGLNDLAKLRTFDGAANQCDFQNVKYHLAFIDAEHTDEAVFADFLGICDHLERGAVCGFHDTHLITAGVENILCFLRHVKRPHVFAVFRDSWMSALFLDRKLDEVPRHFIDGADHWPAFKDKSRDKLLLQAMKYRVNFVLKPKPTFPM